MPVAVHCLWKEAQWPAQIMAHSLIHVGGASGDHLVQHFAQRRDSSEIQNNTTEESIPQFAQPSPKC